LGLIKLFNPWIGIKIILKNQDLLFQLVKRNIAARYKGSVLGLFWSLVQPLIMLTVYTFVFSVIFKARWGIDNSDSKAAFAIIMFCGMAVFNIFSESVNGGCGLITGNPNYVKKVIFPLEILPIAQVSAATALGLIWFGLLFLGAVIFMKSLAWTMLLLPLVLIPLVLLSCGLSFLAASLSVFFRDIQHLIGVIIQILFFMTPIFYPVQAIPEQYRWVMQINPLSSIVEQARTIFLYGKMLDWTMYGTELLIALIIFQFGLVWFIKTKKGFADVL
jgi:lipopolysaccharide transport system permease protein